MQKTRLVRFLKSLNQNEIRQFRDFIYSPVFNKNKNVTELFDILFKYYPEFEARDLNEEKLYEIIFRNKDFEYFKIKNLISDLFALGKEFLAFNSYKIDQNAKQIYLLRELRNRNLDTAFERAYKYAADSLEKIKVKDEDYFLNKMNLQFELMSYYSPKKPNVNFHYLQERLDLFVSYSVIFLLKIYNIMLHENNQNNYNFDMKMFDNVMAYLEKNKFSDNPALEVYYYILLMEKTKDEKYFYILKKLKDKYRKNLGNVDNYMLYLHLDGYCATAYNNFGRTDLLYEQFILAKEHPVSDTTESGKILYPDFLNQVKKAVRVNEFEWSYDFIERYKIKLNEEKENTLNFCYGYISYQKGETDLALDYFSKTTFSNFIIKIQVKILLLQLYIEKEYYDQALLMIDSFRHFIAREKAMLDSIKTSIMEFLKITSELVRIRSAVSDRDTEFKIAAIKKDVENMSNNRFGIKLWLKKKVSQL